MAEHLIYQGIDIIDSVEVGIASYDTIADCTQADTLRLTFSTKDDGWANWRPVIGDTAEYKRDGASTGLMYVYDFDVQKTYTTLYLSSMPPAVSAPANQSKKWEKIYLSQIGGDIAGKYGMAFELMQMEDIFYDAKQVNKGQSDAAFLGELAKQEGAVLVFYDGRIIMASEKEMESQEPVYALDMEGTTYDCVDQSDSVYGRATVKSGAYVGIFEAREGGELSVQGIRVSSEEEAIRAAKGNLRNANKNLATMSVTTKIVPELTAGITMKLEGEKPAGWNGILYAYRIRHEWHNNQTVVFLRKPLEGY